MHLYRLFLIAIIGTALCFACPLSDAQLTTLANFGSGAAMVQGLDGYFYGTTDYSIFQVNSRGAGNTIYFDCEDRSNCPDGYQSSGIAQASDGNLYGTNLFGGSPDCDCGTVFELSNAGNVLVLHTFDGSDGVQPESLMDACRTMFFGV